MEYDIIGDVHGYMEPLKSLLKRLGYTKTAGGWKVPAQNRKIVFLGDVIDRGPEQKACVSLVRELTDAGHASCVMGNHEHAAIGWTLEDASHPGEWMRPHNPTNTRHHREFLSQFGEGSDLHKEAVRWMEGLPIYLDLDEIRCVHACWHPGELQTVAGLLDETGRFTPRGIEASFVKGSPERHAADTFLRGPEIELPDGLSFVDQEGTERRKSRIKWWTETTGKKLRDMVVDDLDTEEEVALAPVPLEDSRPVFFGHYWLRGTPSLTSKNAACLDFSVAAGGSMTAYMWRGEQELDNSHLVWV